MAAVSYPRLYHPRIIPIAGIGVAVNVLLIFGPGPSLLARTRISGIDAIFGPDREAHPPALRTEVHQRVVIEVGWLSIVTFTTFAVSMPSGEVKGVLEGAGLLTCVS